MTDEEIKKLNDDLLKTIVEVPYDQIKDAAAISSLYIKQKMERAKLQMVRSEAFWAEAKKQFPDSFDQPEITRDPPPNAPVE